MSHTKHELIPVPVELPDIKRSEMQMEDNERYPLDARNLIHKEAILSRRSNAKTQWYKPTVA